MDFHKAVSQGFRAAPFVAHAGVVATLADHCAGAAATTQLAPGEHVVSAEFKINLLRGARGERLHCRAEVLKPGQTLSVVEAVVFAEHAGRREMVAKLNATMAVIKARHEPVPAPAAPAG